MRSLVGALLLTLSLEGVALAEGDALEIWTPLPAAPRAIPAGPLELHVVRRREAKLAPVGEVELRASEGEVRQLPSPDPFLARALFLPPPQHKGAIRLFASPKAGAEAATEAELALSLDDSAMPTVEVSVEHPILTKGQGQSETRVVVRTKDAAGRPRGKVPPRIFTNTGTVTAPVRVGPGHFEARYAMSKAPFPEVAVVVALLPYPHEASAAVSVGHAVIKQPAAIDLPGETRPGVEMTVEIAGERYGPVQADERGRFKVPVVVPPGVGTGTGLSKDKLGNVKRTRVDLRLPPTKRLALAAHPRELVADGGSRALVVLTALTAAGDPLTAAQPEMRAARGEVGPVVEVEPGVFQAWYTAPRGMSADAENAGDTLSASLKGDKTSTTELPIQLVSGPPVSLAVTVEQPVITAPSPDDAVFPLALVDAYGSPVTDAVIVSRSKHGSSVTAQSQLRYTAPGSPRPGSDRVIVRARARARGEAVKLSFAPPATLIATDALGRPVPGAEVRAEGRVVFADEEGKVLLPASSGIVTVQLPGSVLPTLLHLGLGTDGQLHGAPTSPPLPERVIDLTLAPPHAVSVEAEMGPREGGRVLVRYVVKGATSGAVHIFVDDERVAAGDAPGGEAWVQAEGGAFITVTHVPSGIGAAVRAAGAT